MYGVSRVRDDASQLPLARRTALCCVSPVHKRQSQKSIRVRKSVKSVRVSVKSVRVSAKSVRVSVTSHSVAALLIVWPWVDTRAWVVAFPAGGKGERIVATASKCVDFVVLNNHWPVDTIVATRGAHHRKWAGEAYIYTEQSVQYVSVQY